MSSAVSRYNENAKSPHYGPDTEGVSARFVGRTSKSAKQLRTGASPCQGLYWTKTDSKPSTAFIAVHYATDFTQHYLAIPLALRGYGFLGWNTRFRGAEDRFELEKALDDIAAGTEWLKNVAGVEKIIFIGYSGGGSLMAAFQASAQKDPSLVGADEFIFLSAHLGRPNTMTNSMDPSILDEADPTKTDPSLDMYNPENKVPYSPEFIAQYRAAQVERNHRMTKWAKSELKRLNAAGISDRNFGLYRTMADLRVNDATIDPSDRLVPSCYNGDPSTSNRSISFIGRATSLKTWLSMWSLEDSQCKFEPYAATITIPCLVIQGTYDTGVFKSDATQIFNTLETKEKELKFIPGDHFFDEDQETFDRAIDTVVTWVERKS